MPPKYVMDEMELYEINSLLKYQYYKDKENWEQTRMLGFINARSNGAKINKVESLLKFPWEKQPKEKPQFISDEQMKNYRQRAKWVIENNMLEQ